MDPKPWRQEYERSIEEYARRKREETARVISQQLGMVLAEENRYTNAKGFRSTPIRPPPADFLIQYIGGPKNAEQEYLSYKDHVRIFTDRAIYETTIPGHVILEVYKYRIVLIPQDETPFSDAQIVLGLFVA